MHVYDGNPYDDSKCDGSFIMMIHLIIMSVIKWLLMVVIHMIIIEVIIYVNVNVIHMKIDNKVNVEFMDYDQNDEAL